MKIAIRREPGHIPGSGYHYFMHPIPLKDKFEEACFAMMGHAVVDVRPEERAEELLKAARAALTHQCEIAVLAEQQFNLDKKL